MSGPAAGVCDGRRASRPITPTSTPAMNVVAAVVTRRKACPASIIIYLRSGKIIPITDYPSD